MAVSCWVPPTVRLAVAGVTAMVWSVGAVCEAVTVKEADPVTPLKVAVMVEVPAATAVATPELLIVAVALLELLQLTLEVMFAVELSLNVPVAVYCWAAPTVIWAVVGPTTIPVSVLAGVPGLAGPGVPDGSGLVPACPPQPAMISALHREASRNTAGEDTRLARIRTGTNMRHPIRGKLLHTKTLRGLRLSQKGKKRTDRRWKNHPGSEIETTTADPNIDRIQNDRSRTGLSERSQRDLG